MTAFADKARVLIVCPRFAPVNAADMHRVRLSLPYYGRFGWEPTVISVRPHLCGQAEDGRLMQTVPEHVRIVRTGALPLKATRLLGFSDLATRSKPFIRAEGTRLLSKEKFEIVFFSTTAFGVIPLGIEWLERFGIPFVVDLQDPWLNDYYDQPGSPPPPGGRLKYSISRWRARLEEPRTLTKAAHIITTSPKYPEIVRGRYPSISESHFSVLPFGASSLDMELATSAGVSQEVFSPGDGLQHWVYIGRAGGDMSFALKSFFRAVAEQRRESPAIWSKIRIHFVGTSYAAGSRARKSVLQLAAEAGVADVVSEREHRIGYFESLRCLEQADVLLIFGSDDASYSGSKLYPYILARRPILLMAQTNSPMLEVLRATNSGVGLSFNAASSVESFAREISTALRTLNREPPETDWDKFGLFSAAAMTRAQCEIFDRVRGGNRLGAR